MIEFYHKSKDGSIQCGICGNKLVKNDDTDSSIGSDHPILLVNKESNKQTLLKNDRELAHMIIGVIIGATLFGLGACIAYLS